MCYRATESYKGLCKSYAEKRPDRQGVTFSCMAAGGTEKYVQECHRLRPELSVIVDIPNNPNTNRQSLNLPLQLSKLREKLCLSAKAVSTYRQQAATHVFVFMTSAERWNQKPYALPVRCVPNKSLKAFQLRHLTSEIVEEMHKRGMNVVGKCFFVQGVLCNSCG